MGPLLCRKVNETVSINQSGIAFGSLPLRCFGHAHTNLFWVTYFKLNEYMG